MTQSLELPLGLFDEPDVLALGAAGFLLAVRAQLDSHRFALGGAVDSSLPRRVLGADAADAVEVLLAAGYWASAPDGDGYVIVRRLGQLRRLRRAS